MGLTSQLLRLPRPRTFLYTMSLTTGATLITLSLLLNKLSGFYGLLALLTGFELNRLQLSMYMYSLVALVLAAYLAPHIRHRSPFHALALAWLYLIDSIINAAYTATFAVTWFLVLAQHHAGQSPSDVPSPGAATIDDTSGFTRPEFYTAGVDIAEAKDGSYDDVAGDTVVSSAASVAAGSGGKSRVSQGVLLPESMNSLGIVITLWTIRVYFCVVMLSYARMVLRAHIACSAVKSKVDYTTASRDAGMAENPFAPSKPEGHGWKGRLGRLMVSFPRWYWLGAIPGDDEDQPGAFGRGDAWMQGAAGRRLRVGGSGDESGSSTANGPANAVDCGPTERERRRRSGTGPPPPPIQVINPTQQKGLTVPLQDLS